MLLPRILLLLLFCFYSTFAYTTTSLEQSYLVSESKIQLGLIQEESKLGHLKTYPLYPYLVASLFQKKIEKASLADFLHFQQRFHDLPFVTGVMEKWMEVQKTKKKWENLLPLTIPKKHLSLRCSQAMAYFYTPKTLPKEELFDLWENAIPASPACIQLFKNMHQQKLLSLHHFNERLHKSFTTHPKTATELLSILPLTLFTLATAYTQAENTPKKVLTTLHKLPAHPLKTLVISRAFRALAQRDIAICLYWFNKIKKEAPLSSEERAHATKAIAIQLAKQQQSDALHWMAAIPKHLHDEHSREWYIRAALKHADFALAKQQIEALPEHMKEEPRWQYWLARSYGELGQEKQAKQLYKKIAPKRNFYSFLASERLHLPHHLEYEKNTITDSELYAIQKMPWFQRMQAFKRLGKVTEARREWQTAQSLMTDRQLLATSKALYQLGHYYQALYTLVGSQLKNDIRLRFPLAHLTHISAVAKKHALEPAWIYAITRQESAFRTDARSSVGAMGLMQLMPRTAKFIAKQIRYPYSKNTDLYQANINLQLGTAYFTSLKKMMRGNPILAAAAYNAGPGRIQGWLPEKAIAADLWIETIPYVETREYVSNILAYLSIYGHLLGQPTRLSKWMTPIQKINPT